MIVKRQDLYFCVYFSISVHIKLLLVIFQALVGLAFSIGFIVGPLAGAWFAKSNMTSGLWGEKPALYALSLSLANITLVTMFIPETLSKVSFICNI